ncbi:MAG: DsbA family protein [Gemmatimonadota bacterium]
MAKKSTTSSGGTRLFYVLLAIVAVAGVASIIYSLKGSGGAATQPIKLSGLDNPRELYELATAVKQGPDNAPVKVVEFADYSCPACRQFDMNVLPDIKKKYLGTGKVQFIFYDFPLVEIHAHSFLAARAARCAGDQGKFWEFSDALFRSAPNWAERRQAPTSDFENLAGTLGLDKGEFSSCLKSNKYADVVTANRRLAEQLGIDSTPTVIVNNRRWNGPLNDPASLEQMIQSDMPGQSSN